MRIDKVLALVSPASTKVSRWEAELAAIRRRVLSRRKARRRPVWLVRWRLKAALLKRLIARERKRS